MGAAIGIDVGSTTAKVVVLSGEGEPLHRACERHRGRPHEVVARLLAGARERHPAAAAAGVTGSLGVGLAGAVGATPVHEVHAVTLAVRARRPGVRTVVELGGQDAKLVHVGRSTADDDAQMNDRCAAGTGATIDRIARRLGWPAGELAALRLRGDQRVAAKCGVFAETDVVNLIKQGARPEDAMSALVRAIVVQNLAVLARGRLVRPPVLLLGGPHAHLPALAEAWRQELGALWAERGREPGPVEVPEHAALFGATGAALHAARGGRALARVRSSAGRRRAEGALLDEDGQGALEALRCAPAPRPPEAGEVRACLGVDAGSTSSKAVLLAQDGTLLAEAYGPSRGDPVTDAKARLAALWRRMRAAGAEPTIVAAGVTGYGAELVGPALGADWSSVETEAHARAALSAWPEAEVVVDVGGTDIKVLRVDRGRVADFFVSNQCSAGHGAFLAATAEDLGVPLEQYATRALSVAAMPRFTVGCGIFMDTDRVTFQRDGWSTDEILAGLARAVARNVWEHVVPEAPERLGRRFLLTGGTQRNLAAAWAQARYLRERVPGAEVRVHPHPALCGAIGAALEAAAHRRAPQALGAFAERVAAVRVRTEVGEHTRCRRCELSCARSFVSLGHGEPAADEARRLVVGNACERGADPGSTGRRSRAHAPDLLDREARTLFRRLLPAPRPPRADAPVIGIPRVMAMYRSAPLLLGYLRAAGVPEEHLVLSPPTSAALFQQGARWGVADPCFPSKLVLAHVDWLLRRHRERPLHALLMPTITHAAIAVRGTADTASCPIVAACGHTSVAALRREGDVLGELGIRALSPELCLVDRARLEEQLHDAFGPLLGLDRGASRAALEHGLAAQRRYHDRCRRAGAKVLSRARAEGRAVAVVLARPYHADPGVQHGISTELAARGVPTLGLSSLPIEGDASLDLSDVLPQVTNSGCAEKVWAARRIAADPSLLAVDLSSFRCGQDASILSILGEVLGRADKPALRLHDLDEDRPSTSFRLRVRTFVEAARRYEAERLRPGATDARHERGEARA